MAPPSVPAPAHISSLLQTLHAQSLEQEATLAAGTFAPAATQANATSFDELMLDKFIALAEDKCAFVYNLLRAIDARTVVEAGTSFGVSTIYLALAVGQNAARDAEGKKGRVIATEKEVAKAERAKGYWAQAGAEIQDVIDLRVGDLRETLKGDLGIVDFLLLDIWTPMALPALQLAQPYMRPGALIIADNTVSSAEGYREFFEYVDKEGSPFRRITLPYKGGLEMITYKS